MSDLDFSGLMNTPNTDYAPNAVNTDTSEIESNNAQTRLKNKASSIQATYKRLEEMKRNTSTLKVTLIKDLEQGDKDIKDLLADALNIIGTATNDTAFLNTTFRHLNDNYSKGV